MYLSVYVSIQRCRPIEWRHNEERRKAVCIFHARVASAVIENIYMLFMGHTCFRKRTCQSRLSDLSSLAIGFYMPFSFFLSHFFRVLRTLSPYHSASPSFPFFFLSSQEIFTRSRSTIAWSIQWNIFSRALVFKSSFALLRRISTIVERWKDDQKKKKERKESRNKICGIY